MLAFVISTALIACGWNPLTGIGYREGGHELVARDGTTVASFARDVACAQGWARAWYHDSTITYRDSEGEVAAYVKVHGDAIMRWGFPVAGTVVRDTVYFVAHYEADGWPVIAHEQLHVVQARHPELFVGGDLHFPPLWTYCGLPTQIG